MAKKYEDEMHKIQDKRFLLTEKLDGARGLIFINDTEVKVFSRQGPIVGLVDIEKEFKDLPNGVYDDELVIDNTDDYRDRDVLQKTLKITRKDSEKTGLIFHVFD